MRRLCPALPAVLALCLAAAGCALAGPADGGDPVGGKADDGRLRPLGTFRGGGGDFTALTLAPDRRFAREPAATGSYVLSRANAATTPWIEFRDRDDARLDRYDWTLEDDTLTLTRTLPEPGAPFKMTRAPGNPCTEAGGECVAQGSCAAPGAVGDEDEVPCGGDEPAECCLPPSACRPVCDAVGTADEGWYDGCTHAPICKSACAAAPGAACDAAGTPFEGWYARGGHGCGLDGMIKKVACGLP